MIVEEEKNMKTFVKIISCFILFVSSLIFCATLTTEKIIKEDISSILVNKLNINEEVSKVLTTFGPLLKQDITNTTFIEQETIEQFIRKYTPVILQDLAGGDNHQNYDMNSDIQDILLEHSNTFKPLIKDTLSDKEKEQIISTTIKVLDMQSIYDTLITQAKNNVSNEELLVIHLASILVAPSTKISSGMISALTIALLCLLEIRDRHCSYMMPVSLTISGLTILLLYVATSRIGALQIIDFSILLFFSISYIVLAILLAFILQRVNTRKIQTF